MTDETELQALLARLTRLEQTKSAFISIAAHELKTPLTLVHGYATILSERLQGRPDCDELISLVAGILRGAQRLREIIDDMIDVASIEAQSLADRPGGERSARRGIRTACHNPRR